MSSASSTGAGSQRRPPSSSGAARQSAPGRHGSMAVTSHRKTSTTTTMTMAGGRVSSSASASGCEKSAWTPLNNAAANQQLFGERMALLRSWFTNWSDGQRELCLSTLVPLFNDRQVHHVYSRVARERVEHADFTRLLPRCISLYIFSFLDPRSLCRSAVVCWYWKMLCDLDDLWAPKCIRFSWLLPYQPAEFEQGAWKRLYVMKVESLRLAAAARRVAEEEEAIARATAERRKELARKRKAVTTVPAQAHIWRDPDPKPGDLEKFSKKIRTSAKETDDSFLAGLVTGATLGQSAAVGKAASEANKLLMKSGPVDMTAIAQPTKASLHRSRTAQADIAVYKDKPLSLKTSEATATAKDRLQAFKRAEKHRRAVVEAMARNGEHEPRPALSPVASAGSNGGSGETAVVVGTLSDAE